MLFQVLSLALQDLLVYQEYGIGLLTKLEVSELESCLDKHKNWHFRLQWESILGQIVSINGLLKLADLLRAEREDLKKRQESFDAERVLFA